MQEKQSNSLFLGLVFILMALSSIVILEPAPVDILAIFLFFWGLFRFRYSRSIGAPIVLLLTYIISNFLSAFVVEDVTRGVFFLTIKVYLLISWLLIVGVVQYFDTKSIKAIFTGYTIAAIFSIIIGLLGFFHVLPWDFLTFADRPKGLFKDPNVFGPFVIPVALYAGLQFESSKKINKLGWGILFLLFSIGTALSFSRAAWLNYGVAFSSCFILRTLTVSSMQMKVRRLSTYGILLISLVAIFLGLLAIQPDIANFFAQRSSLQGYDDVRFEIQQVALNNALSSFTGIGPGQTEVVYDYATHSSYIRVLVESSWLGEIGFFGFVGLSLTRSFRMALKANHPNQELFIIFTAALLGILANSFFIDTIHWRHFWLLLALPWGSYTSSSSTKTLSLSLDNETCLTKVN